MQQLCVRKMLFTIERAFFIHAKSSALNRLLRLCLIASKQKGKRYLKPTVRTYKRRFDRELKHIKLTLTRERLRLPVNEWLELVENTRQSILSRPQDYICGELPPPTILANVIEQVFAGFLEDQRLRAVQTGRPFRIPDKRHE